MEDENFKFDLELLRGFVSPSIFDFLSSTEADGILQNLDCGLWTGPWTGLWTEVLTTLTQCWMPVSCCIDLVTCMVVVHSQQLLLDLAWNLWNLQSMILVGKGPGLADVHTPGFISDFAQEGANPNPRGGNPILNIGNCQGGKSIPRGGESTPSPPLK